MSLNSLKRELEVQKAKTESAREEATERIEETKQRSSGRSWVWIVGAIVIVVGVVWAILSTIPSVREWQFELVRGDFDAGPPFDAGVIEPPEVDAGIDSGPRRTMQPRMNMTMSMRPTLDFGDDDDDPLGGLD